MVARDAIAITKQLQQQQQLPPSSAATKLWPAKLSRMYSAVKCSTVYSLV